ncbi:hypothetical protein HOG21_07230 [bacterium]|nr:hypothetical protein [bacterium]
MKVDAFFDNIAHSEAIFIPRLIKNVIIKELIVLIIVSSVKLVKSQCIKYKNNHDNIIIIKIGNGNL